MSVSPYEYSIRDNGSDNLNLPYPIPAVQHTQHAQPADGNPTYNLGDTTFKVTWAAGFDPDYYKNIQQNQGVDWDYFKQANIFNVPNPGGSKQPPSGISHNGATAVGS